MKMTPSILLNIVLVTVLATSMFFISTTASMEYNPWSDIDGDGEITIYDVVKLTGIYGSSGDPTRNVTVTNWPQRYATQEFEFNISWNDGMGEFYYSEEYDAEGYSRMFATMWLVNHSEADCSGVTIQLNHIYWRGGTDTMNYSRTYGWSEGVIIVNLYPPVAEAEVKAPSFRMQFTANSTLSSGWAVMHVFLYLRNE
ncbi:hypothetical protein KAU92_04085 [Candidatus Bathyarchaeota archaeon]|nr:hypothetical protein [Candidatus Bathyarchaeota archaeon]